MAKVFIFGMAGVIVIGLIMLLIFGGSLATKLASLFWGGKKKKIEERSDRESQEAGELCPRCGHPVFSRVFHHC